MHLNNIEDIQVGHTSRTTSTASWKSSALLGLASLPLWLLFNIPITALGLAWFVFILTLFINRLGNTIPVLELMLLIACMQWIVGARLGYLVNQDHFKYFMYVDEIAYMNLAVPGTIFFSLGILLFMPKYDFEVLYENIRQYATDKPKVAQWLIIFGFGADFIGSWLPPSLMFVAYLATALKYVGLTLLLFSPDRKKRRNWLFVILGLLLFNSILRGLFHDLILWSALLSSFLFLQWQLSYRTKVFFISMGFLFIIILQAVKSEYRAVSQLSGDQDKISQFSNLFFGQVMNFDDLLTTGYIDFINVRFNQGWIISSIIHHIPISEPYAEGETIFVALENTLLPRFLSPSKKIAGGRENFRRMTGLDINESTSMGTSVLGEAYGNFGYQGAAIFMFIWGAFLAWTFSKLIKWSFDQPLIIAFIPLIFLQVIKAETEFFVVLNHFVKSILFVFVLFWFGKRFWGW